MEYGANIDSGGKYIYNRGKMNSLKTGYDSVLFSAFKIIRLWMLTGFGVNTLALSWAARSFQMLTCERDLTFLARIILETLPRLLAMRKSVVSALVCLFSLTAISSTITISGNNSIPALSSSYYWSWQGATPADGTVQSINPPLFKWIYCPSYDRAEMGADQNGRDLHVFRFQLTTNGTFASPYWDIYTSNNFENCLPPITNSDGSPWLGTCSWRIIYYDRYISTIQETDTVHTFTLAINATNWDRSMLASSNYLWSVTHEHPHMYFSTNNRTAFADYLRNQYTGPHGWQELTNIAYGSVTNGLTSFVAPTSIITNWWNNEQVFTNLPLPQLTFPFIETVLMDIHLETNTFLLSSNPATMVDMACRWWINTGQDRVPPYQNQDTACKALPVMIDWAWPWMDVTQRSNAVYALDCTARFLVWEDWWCEGSALDPSRTYAYSNRFINISSAAKYGDSHQRYDWPQALICCMSCWSDSTNLPSLLPYSINYMIGLYTEGRMDEGRSYDQADFDGSRTFAEYLESVFLFRSAKLERNPLMATYLSQFSYMETPYFRQLGDPFGDFAAMPIDFRPLTGQTFNNQSSFLFLNYNAKLWAIVSQNGAALRQYNRWQSIYNATVSTTPFTPLQDTGVSILFNTPSETDWPSNDWVVPEQGYASFGSTQPNDFSDFTNGVRVWMTANPGTKNEHGQIADGVLQMSAYGAQVIGGHVGDYIKHLMCGSGGIFVDGIGTLRMEAPPKDTTTNRAQFISFTNGTDFSYLRSDITKSYPQTNYSNILLSNYNTAANFYQYASNSRPYLTSMKRHVLFPHKKYLVLYDEMSTTTNASFQWLWKVLEPTISVNTNGCSFTYTCTNFLNGSNVTVYVVPFVNPSSMTCSVISGTNLSYTNIITKEFISYTNSTTGAITGQGYYPDGNSQVSTLFNSSVFIQNSTPSTNWHYGFVVYPAKWNQSAPTITRNNDYSVSVSDGVNNDTIVINSSTGDWTLDFNGSISTYNAAPFR